MKQDKIGILLTNIGSPDEPTASAVRRYLKKFLSDKRVVELPKLIWAPILYGFILPFRSRASAKLYRAIWQKDGSPLTVFSKKLAHKLQKQLNLPVEIGMHYGNPSIAEALAKLQKKTNKIIILPLYPQYAGSTTASAFDAINRILARQRHIPAIDFKNDYADHPAYITAVSQTIQQHLAENGKPQHLLFSFHGLPAKYCLAGDPYESRCRLSAELIAEKLQIPRNAWSVAFQSRLGKAQWLTPYTDHVLAKLAKSGKTDVAVVCPGFAVDCLETLEEIMIRGKKQFTAAGGKVFHYIPALNDTDLHVSMLQEILA